MTAHTYWRLTTETNNGGAVLNISEIEFRTSLNGANVALASMTAAPSIVNRSSNVLGAAALTMIQNGSVDDNSLTVPLPFTVSFLGVSYNTVYVGSNSYVTFGASAGGLYSGVTGSNPAIPNIQICTGDRSYQRVYTGTENSGATFRIRWEGSTSTGGTPGSPTMVWEITFNRDTPDVILVDMGTNAAEGSGATGVSDSTQYVLGFANGTTNTGYTLAPGNTNPTGFITTSAGGGLAAFDGAPGTAWSVAPGAWIQYRFSVAKDIIQHVVRADNIAVNAPKRWSISYSDDGVSWTNTVTIMAQENWGPSEARTFTDTQWPPKANAVTYGTAEPIPGAVSPSTIGTTAPRQFYAAKLTNAGWPATIAPIQVKLDLNSTASRYRYLPWWAVDYRGYFPNDATTLNLPAFNNGYTLPSQGISVSGTISGQVQEEGLPVAGKLVRLYYRPTGALIANAISDATGRYTFRGLEPSANVYVITAFNQAPLQYDAVIHDNISAL
jgi:hypothetical protein